MANNGQFWGIISKIRKFDWYKSDRGLNVIYIYVFFNDLVGVCISRIRPLEKENANVCHSLHLKYLVSKETVCCVESEIKIKYDNFVTKNSIRATFSVDLSRLEMLVLLAEHWSNLTEKRPIWIEQLSLPLFHSMPTPLKAWNQTISFFFVSNAPPLKTHGKVCSEPIKTTAIIPNNLFGKNKKSLIKKCNFIFMQLP